MGLFGWNNGIKRNKDGTIEVSPEARERLSREQGGGPVRLTPKGYEHKTITRSTFSGLGSGQHARELDRLTNQGWELVSSSTARGVGVLQHTYVLRRPKY